ncbi:nucleoporin Nup44 [Phyllosticta citricarpa]|uniref:Nucleoporin Nup44 n=2 Tax=Phyllosticta TaxID=121621 RepID=A0ABR1MD21_9PEZI
MSFLWNQGSTFGGSQPSGGSGLFGNSLGASQNNQQPQGNSLFGGSTNTQQNQPAPAQSVPLGQSVFGTPLPPPQPLGAPNASSSVWQPPPPAHQKSIPEQMKEVITKWDPSQSSSAFQYYFYNQVEPRMVPYYVAPSDEDPKAWEEALSKKPNEGAIPVLGRGFTTVGARLEQQAKAVGALQTRLHEMNNTLDELLRKHDLEVSVRVTEAKRKHVALTKRCLQLAAKAQVLRNRGYAMDPREEELKKTLKALERKVFDPMLNGKQEEIWGKLHGIRMSARRLQEEVERMGRKTKVEEEPLDEESVKAIKKVLNDFDQQLEHLRKELNSITKEWTEWHDASTSPANTR